MSANTTTGSNEPTVITASIKGFTYIKDFAFLTVSHNGHNANIIIGAKADNPISELIQLKGLSAEFISKGTKEVNGTTYPMYQLQCIAF